MSQLVVEKASRQRRRGKGHLRTEAVSVLGADVASGHTGWATGTRGGSSSTCCGAFEEGMSELGLEESASIGQWKWARGLVHPHCENRETKVEKNQDDSFE